MTKFKYLDKNKKTVPQFKVGEHVWYITRDDTQQETEIRGVNIRWVDYGGSPYVSDPDHWEISYRHKPCFFNQRMVQWSLLEEDAYTSKEDALKATFLRFKEYTIKKLERFRSEIKKLGINDDIITLIDKK